MYIIIFAVCLIMIIVLYITRKNREYSLGNEHLLITGGSSGIGLAIAIEAAGRGASVTLVARNQERLTNARELVQKHTQREDQKVLMFTADVAEGPEPLEDVVKQAEENAGPITLLVNCAGTSVASRFEETSVEEFKNMININYFGSMYMTRVVVPRMKSQKKGNIVFVSSLAGLFGMYGYTAYSASKFALVGLAQALQMEVKPYGIGVTVSFPPDTDTPGFVEEMKSKPLETQLICETAGVFQASTVAAKTLRDVMNKSFLSSVGFEGWVLCTLCSGMSPVSSVVELLSQVLTMGAFRVMGYMHHNVCNKIIKRCMAEKEAKNKQE